MEKLFSQRLSKNLKQNIKYLTLVFNDFFIFALIILLGAFLFWYAQILQKLPDNQWFYRPLTGIILFSPLLFGKLATLLESADSQFIWTQDEEILGYLKKARSYSMLFPSLMIAVISGIVFPFATVKAGLSLFSFLTIVVALFLLKFSEFNLAIQSLYTNRQIGDTTKGFHVLAFLAVNLGVYVPSATLIAGLIFAFLTIKLKPQLFSWLDAIDYEQKRQEVVLGFYSLFTDVKNRPIKIKRRKYLDGLLTKNLAKVSPDQYLFERSLVRNPESLNLVVRMTVFAILLAAMVQENNWALGLDALVIFLTAYQLLPLYHQYENNLMYRVLPLKIADKQLAFKKVLRLAILAQVVLISLGWLIFLPITIQLLLRVFLLFVLALALIYGYVPMKLKQVTQKTNRPNRPRKRK